MCPSVDEWIKKALVHLHNGLLLSHKKEGNLTLCTAWMDPEGIMLSEISQSEKKYCMKSEFCSDYNEQNELTNKRETDS